MTYLHEALQSRGRQFKKVFSCKPVSDSPMVQYPSSHLTQYQIRKCWLIVNKNAKSQSGIALKINIRPIIWLHQFEVA